MLRELVMIVADEAADSFADALLDVGALSVSIEDAEADTADEQPLYGEPGLEPTQQAWRRNRVIAQCDAAVDATALVRAAADACGLTPAPTLVERDIADDDWVRRTQSQFPPQQVGARLWIVPSWHEPPPDPSAVVIRLDPGVAFGTGTHPTTRLCLQWLDEHPPRDAAVLDYGCGSGILAIAAARLGAGVVHGTDIDAQAVAAARANAGRNAVAARFTLPDELPAQGYDVVVANILANPLRALAELLVARVVPGGALVLSGILERQGSAMQQHYRSVAPHLSFEVWRSLDGWSCLVGHRPSTTRETVSRR